MVYTIFYWSCITYEWCCSWDSINSLFILFYYILSPSLLSTFDSAGLNKLVKKKNPLDKPVFCSEALTLQLSMVEISVGYKNEDPHISSYFTGRTGFWRYETKAQVANAERVDMQEQSHGRRLSGLYTLFERESEYVTSSDNGTIL